MAKEDQENQKQILFGTNLQQHFQESLQAIYVNNPLRGGKCLSHQIKSNNKQKSLS